jgi:hypothetical protein
LIVDFGQNDVIQQMEQQIGQEEADDCELQERLNFMSFKYALLIDMVRIFISSLQHAIRHLVSFAQSKYKTVICLVLQPPIPSCNRSRTIKVVSRNHQNSKPSMLTVIDI